MLKATLSSLCLLLAILVPTFASAAPTTSSLVAALTPTSLEGTVNLNTASEAQLMMLPGVGPATAAKMVVYRDHHAFRRISHVMRIKGIGKKTFARLRPYLAVAGETTLRSVESPRLGQASTSPH